MMDTGPSFLPPPKSSPSFPSPSPLHLISVHFLSTDVIHHHQSPITPNASLALNIATLICYCSFTLLTSPSQLPPLCIFTSLLSGL